MFGRVHVFIDFAACMCVVALEGGQRHKEKEKKGKICHLAAQNVYHTHQCRHLGLHTLKIHMQLMLPV